jgi:hypothetical protein
MKQMVKEQEKSEKSMRSTKRVILADGSRLVREMLHRVIDKAEYLQVVDEVPRHEGLHLSIRRFGPEWVIMSLPYTSHLRNWIDACLAEHPSVRFIFLSPQQNHIRIKWKTSREEVLSDLTLKEFINILEKDLQ